MIDIKKILNLLYKSKFHILIFSLSFFIFFIFFFPSDVVINYTLNKINDNKHFSFTPEDSSLTVFPNIGFKFTRAKLTFSDGKVLNINKGKLGLSIISIFTFSPVIKADVFAFRGNFKLNLSGFSFFKLNQLDELDLDLLISNIYFSRPLTDFINFDLTALINGKLNGKLNLAQSMYSSLNFDFKLDNIKLNKNVIQGIDIPQLEISNGILKGGFSRGDLSFDNLSIGSNDEDLMLSLRGRIKTTYQKPYDFIISLKLAGELEKEYGGILKLGPVSQYQNTEGVYNFKIKGDMRNPIPSFESL
jgi:type II secretion system protein N